MDWTIKDARSAFRRKLIAMAKAIRRESRGRICGDCRYYRSGTCDRFDTQVLVLIPDAPACKRFEKKST